MNALVIKRQNKRMLISEIAEDKYLLRMTKLLQCKEEKSPSVFHHIVKDRIKHSDVLISYEGIKSLYALTHEIIMRKEQNDAND